ncbi:hypothetical protein RHA1_ro02741 [Rhodococcus jostii RHA1]|uniref:Uncharacterized protein n=1 Tax=Rhodococcus jostii (strain RHA1) TaxID=101510 RepID=Q0SD40_RHOJR|nr:hypothetical protein RHA1_ro02741 [Rhodococcus jostii RHA1]
MHRAAAVARRKMIAGNVAITEIIVPQCAQTMRDTEAVGLSPNPALPVGFRELCQFLSLVSVGHKLSASPSVQRPGRLRTVRGF